MTKQINIILAEDGGTITIDGRDYTLTLVDGEKQQEQPTDYSHLVGKWVRFIGGDNCADMGSIGKYYQCTGIEDADNTPIIKTEMTKNDIGWARPEMIFDLSNPFDHNPDTRIPLPDGVEFVGYYRDHNMIFFKMNDSQFLGYSPSHKSYYVTLAVEFDELASFHLEPCQYGELKDGDFFVWNKTVYLLTPQGRVKATKRGNVLNEGIFTNNNLTVHRVVRD